MRRLYNISAGLTLGILWVLMVLYLRDGKEENDMNEWTLLATGFLGLFMAVSMTVVFEKLKKVKVRSNRQYLKRK